MRDVIDVHVQRAILSDSIRAALVYQVLLNVILEIAGNKNDVRPKSTRVTTLKSFPVFITSFGHPSRARIPNAVRLIALASAP